MGGTARRDKKLAVPCRYLKCWPGSAASPDCGSDVGNGSKPRWIGNANPILT